MSEWNPYVYQEFPRHLHRRDGVYVVVANEDEQQAKLRDGWYLSVPEAEAADDAPAEPVKKSKKG